MKLPWRYMLTPRALRDLRRIPVTVRQRVFDALDRLVVAPFGRDARKLRGADAEWRIRVGDWRVRFEYDFEERVIVVLRVMSRGSAYRD